MTTSVEQSVFQGIKEEVLEVYTNPNVDNVSHFAVKVLGTLALGVLAYAAYMQIVPLVIVAGVVLLITLVYSKYSQKDIKEPFLDLGRDLPRTQHSLFNSEEEREKAEIERKRLADITATDTTFNGLDKLPENIV